MARLVQQKVVPKKVEFDINAYLAELFRIENTVPDKIIVTPDNVARTKHQCRNRLKHYEKQLPVAAKAWRSSPSPQKDRYVFIFDKLEAERRLMARCVAMEDPKAAEPAV